MSMVIELQPPEVDQLAQLASQHHKSHYSKAKYGPNGCPIAPYVPLSIQLPNQYQELKLRQRQCAQIKAWWYHAISPFTNPPASTVILGPSGSRHSPVDLSSELVRELSAAMDDALPLRIPSPSPYQVKTSSSHPISISALIPDEFMPLISSHSLLTSVPNVSMAPVLEIPSSFTLDRLLDQSTPSDSSEECKEAETLSNQLRTRTFVSEALNAAISTGITSPRLSPPPLDCDSTTSPPPIVPMREPHTTISLSMSVKVGSISAPPRFYPPKSLLPTPPAEDVLFADSPRPFCIGNLLLSSCPGKKVRLQGPVKGRSSVCRDLETDLKRMKDLGVGCLVCCLDDAELGFLGVPWSEYERVSGQLGIDVLRLPTPEGLPPALSPESLNDELKTLINTYTLRGIPVLVHCRGGVGRAGVFACCWMLKLGLCGWVESLDAGVETLVLVEKVIHVLRKRRSVKAIETYEQVQFLVDFVEFLRQKSR